MNRVREWWEGLGRNNQIILAASTLGVLVALIGFVAWASTPEYVTLFSDLSPQNANAVIDKLREANIPYRTAPGGKTIEVPAQYRDETRIKLASQITDLDGKLSNPEDILKGGGAFNTSQMEGETILRYNEAQISKSIMTLQQVASAMVHIAKPDDSPFVTADHTATAAVVVTLKPGMQLSDENVRAIVRMTQFAYTNLTEKGISVADSQGNVLFDGEHAGGGLGGGERYKQQRQIAQFWEGKLQSKLDEILGVHKAAVLVNVELNGDQKEETKKTVEPGVTTQKTSEVENLKGVGAVQRGGVGAGANGVLSTANPTGGGGPGTPTYAGNATTGDANGNYTHEITNSKSDPNVTETHTIQGEGHIEKLTVSAFVDSKVKTTEVAAIKQTLETIIGTTPGDATRMVSVAQVEFDQTAEQSAKAAGDAARAAENTAKMLSIAVPLGLMLLCFILLARALRRPVRFAPGGQLALAGAPGGTLALGSGPARGVPALAGGGGSHASLALSADGEELQGQTVGSILSGENGPIGLMNTNGPRVYEVIEEAFDRNLESILHLTRSKPEMVAALMKSWIMEDQ